jgi:hypothetical protein
MYKLLCHYQRYSSNFGVSSQRFRIFWLLASISNLIKVHITQYIAAHFRGVYFGGNWCSVNLQDVLSDITWQEATEQIANLHPIATLAFHIHYYVCGVTEALKNGELNIKDLYSFEVQGIHSEGDWNRLREKMWTEGKIFADLLEALPDEKLAYVFIQPKYGIYYSNLHGIIEHTHYHLGQIVLLKKLIRP